jgi:MoaA/NifB/PqqE/SkfB family radical SAM enzyme
MPRLPLKGSIDLTYRCDNHCRHCWLWLPANASEEQRELSFDEIRAVVDQARAMGCREWSISGGEPMLRPDFSQIFDYVTRQAARYSLNTNGTLITPAIARLLKREGMKMVALYGATAEVYDHVTRHPGGFEQAMRGLAYLKEAGAGFTVQLIPMRDNYHQWEQMLELAHSLSPHYRMGAAWLFFSACGDSMRNQEIAGQRLSPRDVVELDRPDPSYEEWAAKEKEAKETHSYSYRPGDDRLFAACIAGRRDFHVDPYGGMTFCCFIKDPALRYDLRQGSLQEAWDVFIPSLADKVRGGQAYLDHCAACELRSDCRWCPVYGYLEHGRFSARVDYLCAVAREARRFRDDWQASHRRYFQTAGITIRLESDLPFAEDTFAPKFERFAVDGPGEDTVSVRHHFSLDGLRLDDLGQEVYRQAPWAIYEKGDSWIYLGISPASAASPVGGGTLGAWLLRWLGALSQRLREPGGGRPYLAAVFNRDHTRARIYNDGEERWRKGDLHSLTLFPSDQILIARLLADRQGCYLHASGVILGGHGLLFVGHSGAGKSTMVKMLLTHPRLGLPLSRGEKGEGGEILCDDRVIVRRWPEGFRVHGAWSHGEVPVVSASSAPLRAIMFLEQAPENQLVPLKDRQAILRKVLACLIRPFVTSDWWEKTLTLVEQIAREVDCYTLRFDKSGRVVDVLERMVREL